MLDDNIFYVYHICITQVGMNNKHILYVKHNNVLDL